MIKRVTLEDGCHFVGEYDGNRRHGKGIKFYPNGATYEGNYFNDRRHGAGVKTTAAGVVKHVKYIHGKLI